MVRRAMAKLTKDEIWQLLDGVKDPEIPVASVVEMGIVREVSLDGDRVHVKMTPTFSGCPALKVMQTEIEAALRDAGAAGVQVTITNHPPWSSDWITPEARLKLKEFGLAPPPMHAGNIELALVDVVACPYCDSQNTGLKNSFGATLCRAIFFCNDCRQPFEQFKPV